MFNNWDFLTKAIDSKKIPHAFIFCGPESFKAAIKFAKMASCPLKGCSECQTCQKIEQNLHPDFFLVSKGESKDIQISQIRDLIMKLSLKPSFLQYKIAVIDSANSMNQEAQSCLLKFLEEPKGQTILILCAEHPDMLLPTIVSRAQKVRFYPKEEENKEAIAEVLKLLKYDLAFKFKFAKESSEKEQDETTKSLKDWSQALRFLMLKKIGDKEEKVSVLKIAKIISSIQSTMFLMSTTNINRKLALETMFLDF